MDRPSLGLLIAAGLLAVALPPPQPAEAATGSLHAAPGTVGSAEPVLLQALEGRSLGVAGRIQAIRKLDRHGYTAQLRIERALGRAADGDWEDRAVAIAWEELASGRPPRFADGDRILVALEPLGTASIWRRRIPGDDERQRTRTVAGAGRAFLKDPGLGSLDLLHHYLSLDPPDRGTATGLGYLASLAAGASPSLAVEAARRLTGRLDAAPGSVLGPKGENAIVRALLRDDAGPELAAALLPGLARLRTPSLQARLREAIREREPEAPARAFHALALASATGLDAQTLGELAARDDAAYRLVVARTAGPRDESLLRALVERDPNPEVRAAALESLVRRDGPGGLADALGGLADPAASVRAVAARSAAAFGPEAVPALRSVAFGRYPGCCSGSAEAPRSAVAGLSLAGPPGRAALAEIARDHPDPSLRKLAGLALGEVDTHSH